MSRVFIIHGWDGHPQECWFPWLQKELEARGFEVHVPEMPDTSSPKIEIWVPYLQSLVGIPDDHTYFIGHSIGVQTILRYLETIDRPVGGVIAIAGFFTLTEGCLGPDEVPIAEPWLRTPIDEETVKKNAKKITALFSDNDPFVPVGNANFFEQRLNAKIIILPHRGHFGTRDSALAVPEILTELLSMSA